jgi:fructuronate reductase
MRYATGLDEKGGEIDVRDPLAARIRQATQGIGEAGALVRAYLDFNEVFGDDLPADARFRAAVAKALGELMRKGAARTVAEFDPA